MLAHNVSKHFQKKYNCDKHFKKLHLETTTKCDLCGKEFKHIKQHIKHAHNIKRNHLCEICDKKFTRNQHLIEHVRVIHKKQHLWPCRSCEKDFINRKLLIAHYEKHHHHTSPQQYIPVMDDNQVTSVY